MPKLSPVVGWALDAGVVPKLGRPVDGWFVDVVAPKPPKPAGARTN